MSEIESGTWVARTRVRDADGVTRLAKRHGPTEAKAKRLLREHLSIRTAAATRGITPDTTIAVIAVTWLEQLRLSDLAVGTKTAYQRALTGFVLPGMGERTVREITPGDVSRWLDSLPTVSNHPRVVLTSILDLAMADNACVANAARDAPRLLGARRKKKTRTAVRALDGQTMTAIIDAITAWEQRDAAKHSVSSIPLRDILTLQVATGTRIGEVLAVRRCDVDLEGARISINGAVKEQADGKLGRGTLKGDSPARSIPLPKAAVELLRARLAAANNPDAADPVFPSRSGTWLWPNNVQRAWRDARAMSTVDLSWVKPHTLRKTVGSAIADTGDVYLASKILGHSSTAITEAHYLDRTRTVAEDVAEVLDGVLDGWVGTPAES